ncbi:hypothetical protein [uncultured Rhodoblastus sp.]|uniref:hypothetical protein n=1 Tax=uncultured Rhodoblastus sp. TaxID=543037 RepID=UPI0025DE9C70|nr:hypothetical protein [uncultured Rhodoblastus sp.]
MTKIKARTHAADIASTPKGAGQYSLVAATSLATKTVAETDPDATTNNIPCRQNAPCACLPTLLNIETALTTPTPLHKSP